MTRSLEHAPSRASAPHTEGVPRSYAPLCVAVLDPGAHALAPLRHERASIGRPDAEKTMAAGGLGLAHRVQPIPSFFAPLVRAFPTCILAAPGGMRVRNAVEELPGAVGVSGDTSDHDGVFAVAGIVVAGLSADTGTAAD